MEDNDSNGQTIDSDMVRAGKILMQMYGTPITEAEFGQIVNAQ